MKVLFFMRSTVYVRNFESTLRLLAERGHRVHVAADVHRELDPTDLIGRLCREYEGITHGPVPAPQSQQWPQLGVALRGALDYLRYLRPEYRDAPKLRRRAEVKAPSFVMAALRRPLVNTSPGRALLRQPHRVVRVQLGQPHQQSADSRGARCRDGVEPADEGRGDPASPRPGRSRDR